MREYSYQSGEWRSDGDQRQKRWKKEFGKIKIVSVCGIWDLRWKAFSLPLSLFLCESHLCAASPLLENGSVLTSPSPPPVTEPRGDRKLCPGWGGQGGEHTEWVVAVQGWWEGTCRVLCAQPLMRTFSHGQGPAQSFPLQVDKDTAETLPVSRMSPAASDIGKTGSILSGRVAGQTLLSSCLGSEELPPTSPPWENSMGSGGSAC